MRRVLQTLSWIALAATVLPSVLLLIGRMDLDDVKPAMLIATRVWFVATPLWMGREKVCRADET